MSDLLESVKTEEEQLGEPITAAVATIISALIAAGTATAAAAATTATTLLTQTGSSVNQAGVISNISYADIKKWYGAEPASGAFYRAPPIEVGSVPEPELAFTMWQESDDSPESVKDIPFKDLTLAQAKLMANWIENTLGPKSKNALSYVMKSTGAGVESVTLYILNSTGSERTESLVVVLYLNNPKIGSVEAGGFLMSSGDFIHKFGTPWYIEDKELPSVIDHIQDGDLYSSGESKSVTYDIPGSNSHSYHLDYQAAEVTTFDFYRTSRP